MYNVNISCGMIVCSYPTMYKSCVLAYMYFLVSDDVRLPVIVEEFANYCKMMHANSDHLFSEEYEV